MHGLLDIPCFTSTVVPGRDWQWFGAVEWLSTANRNCPVRRFLRKKTSLGYFAEKRLEWIWVFLEKKMSFEYCFSETNILWLLYFLCIAQSEVGLWRLQVEAQVLYTCKQIFGLCHSPPRLENQSGSRKIENLLEGKNNFVLSLCQHPKPDMQEKRMLLCDIHHGMWQKEA